MKVNSFTCEYYTFLSQRKYEIVLLCLNVLHYCYFNCDSAFSASDRSAGLWRGSSQCTPAVPAGNATGCRAAGAGRNPRRRSGVCGKHTPEYYGCGCATIDERRRRKQDETLDIVKDERAYEQNHYSKQDIKAQKHEVEHQHKNTTTREKEQKW